jgi:hypothetical protein
MYKLYKCIAIALLVGCVVLTAGCKSEPETPGPSADQTIQLPDGLEVQVGVGSRDEEDLNGSGEDTTKDNTGEETPDDDTAVENPDDNTGENGNTGEENPNNNQSDNTTPDGNKPDEGKPDDTRLPAPGELDYLGFYALTEDQQDAYIESFESLAAFNKWFNEARAKYESQLPEDEIIDGEIDLDKYNP